MTPQEHTSSQPLNDASKTTGAPEGPATSATISHLVVGTACDVFGGFAHASAEAFQSVDAHFQEPRPNLVAGLLRANARFLEEMSHTMESVAKRFQTRNVGASENSATKPSEPAVSA